VLPGLPYGEAIVEAIESSRVMVLVFSSNSNKSPQVMREVERAVSKGIPIIPLRIEQVPPSKSLEYFISAPHWLDALTPPLEKHLQSLAQTVHLLLVRRSQRSDSREGETGADPGTVEEGRATNARGTKTAHPKRSKKWLVVPLAFVLLLAGLAGLWAVFVLRGKTPEDIPIVEDRHKTDSDGRVTRVKTPEGILIVEVNEPTPEVYVDDEKVPVTWDNSGKKAEIPVKPGTRKVEVKKNGFSVDGKELTFKEGGREIFQARLLPAQVAAKVISPPVIQAVITQVEGDKVTFAPIEGKGKDAKKVEEKTMTVAKGVKVVRGLFNRDTKMFVAGDPIEGGLQADVFNNIPDKGVRATIITDMNNIKITEIRLFGARMKK
jgi:hypothetical protein